MRGVALLLLLLAAGCSTAPLADLLDFACPAQMPPPNAPVIGGVAVPQSAPPAAAVPPPASVPVPVPAIPTEQPVPVTPRP
jgi:hypothetical protein